MACMRGRPRPWPNWRRAFDGEIRVRIVDGQGGAVSVKSLSKLLSLGARRGQVLEFVAEPGIADDALPALLAAVQAGLGEEVEPLPAVSARVEEVESEPPLRAPASGSLIQAIAAAPGLPSARPISRCCSLLTIHCAASRPVPSASVYPRGCARCALISRV